MSDPITTLGEAGKAWAETAKPLLEIGARLLENLLGEPCKVSGQLLADQVNYWQWTNRARIAGIAQKKLKNKNIPAKALPPGCLLPLIDAAGNIDDPELQELWAQLLASGVEQDRFQHPLMTETLRRMGSSDARTLRDLTEEPAGSLIMSLGYPIEGVTPNEQTSAARLLPLGILEPWIPPKNPVGSTSNQLLTLDYLHNRLLQFSPFGWQLIAAIMPEVEAPDVIGAFSTKDSIDAKSAEK